MYLHVLQHAVLQIREVLPIGRTSQIDGVLCHAMGFALHEDGSLHLLILEYDAAWHEQTKGAGLPRETAVPVREGTNREQQRDPRAPQPPQLFTRGTASVQCGPLLWSTHQSTCTLCDPASWETTALFTRFLLAGWQPDGVGTCDLEYTYLTDLTLDPNGSALSEIDPAAPLRFNMRKVSISHMVEQPVLLSVSDTPQPLRFTEQNSDLVHSAHIHRVYLADMWSEMEATFHSPVLLEQFSAEELARRWKSFQPQLEEICPRGMLLPVVEYECEEGLSLDFQSRIWLEQTPVSRSSATAFLLRPDEKTGPHGLPLQAAVIQYPTVPNTTAVDAELFRCHRTFLPEDITI